MGEEIDDLEESEGSSVLNIEDEDNSEYDLASSEDDDDDGDDYDDDDEVEKEEVDVEEVASTKPKRIQMDDTVFEVAFHPTKDIIAAGEITGTISVFSYSNTENKKLLDFKHQKESCRCLDFSPDGQRLYSGCRDNSIYCTDMNTGSMLHSFPNAHDQSISSMNIISDNLIASGCEGGVVRVWDTRTFSKVAEFTGRKDYISGLTCDAQKKLLLSTSGDGVLSVYNLRKNTLIQESDQLDDELLCLAIAKGGKKVLCGSATGVLNVYSWNEWGDISDRYPTETDYIESLCTITDDVVCIGGGDGSIKAMFVQPYKPIKTIGKHGSIGIAALKLSPNKLLLASCGGNETVRFWDVSSLSEEELQPEERKGVKRKHSAAAKKEATEFFADL